MSIFVSGAGGKTGRAVVSALARRGEDVCALVRRNDYVQALQQAGARRVIVGDMRKGATWAVGLRSAQFVYHICPNMASDEEEIGELALRCCQTAGIERFVYHSVLHPQVEEMPHHWRKLRTEERIFRSGLSFTILQPAAYMQNILGGWSDIVQRGVYRVPYAPETRLGMVDLEDVADVAAEVLTSGRHDGAIYELSGPDILDQFEVASILGDMLGKRVRAERVPSGEWERSARASGLDDERVGTLQQMFWYYEKYGFWGNPVVLDCLLGRPPTSLTVFIRRHAGGGVT